MSVSPGTKLNQQQTFGYRSFAGSSHINDDSSPSDFTCDLNKNNDATDLSHLPMEIPLKQLVSGSPHLFDRGLSDLRETDKDSSCLIAVYAVSVAFAIGMTIALILDIYLGEHLVFVKGALVSDDKRCTALGHRVLHDGGSSVDAAITAALCLGVVHPHLSGVGGGGIMLVHDIRKNETRVINFQGTAPETLQAEMLQNVSEIKAGLHVGVPGMLRGLHRAHSLYGSLSWEDVISRAAAVAEEGFNVSLRLAEAISKVRGEQLPQPFKDMFFPDGLALLPGSFVKMPGLAAVLQAGLSNFYEGNFSQEIEDEVRANGGVLSRDDISLFSVQVEQPVEVLYNEFVIQVPPPPSAGAALIYALRLVQNFNESDNTENQTYHRTAEALKAALAGLGDPKYNSSLTDLIPDTLSKSLAAVNRQRIDNLTLHSLQTEPTAGQVVVVGPDDLMVSVASSLSKPFGSRIITQSGVLLNSLIPDFSWTNNTRGPTSQPGKTPVSSLLPTIVVPVWNKCGVRAALCSSGGQQSLRAITQVLISAPSFQKEKNDSFSPIKPQIQPNERLIGSEFPEESEWFPDHKVQRVKTNPAVLGILRNKDIIKAIVLP